MTAAPGATGAPGRAGLPLPGGSGPATPPGPGTAPRRRRRLSDVVKRLGQYAWPPPTRRLADPRLRTHPQLRNRRYLRDRLIALPLFAVVAFASLSWACTGVRQDSAYIQDKLMPALVDLADARVSVQIAHGEARAALSRDEVTDLSGLSELYRRRMSRTTSSLAAVSRGGALSVGEEQELQVVSALLVDYGGWINRAQGHAADHTLRRAELSYAWTMLCGDDIATREPCRARSGSDATTIIDRIHWLETQLRDQLHDRQRPGAAVWVPLGVSAVSFVLLGLGLWRTSCFLHRRFRIRPSLPLLVAALPLLAVPFLVADGVLAQAGQYRVGRQVRQLAAQEPPAWERGSGTGVRPSEDERDPHDIDAIAARAHATLRAAGLGPLGDAVAGILPAGLLCAAVTGAALSSYRREYVLISRPGAAS